MKKFTKLLGIVLIIALVMSMGITAAFAAGYTITMETTNGHTYNAYQVFAGDLDADGKKLSNITWGSGVNETALLAALKADKTYGSAFASAETAADVAEVLGNYTSNSDDVIALAKIIAANKKGSGSGLTGLAAGYYLIVDETAATDMPEGQSVSDFMLQVINDVSIKAKDTTVVTEKKVKDADDTAGTVTQWQDSADHDIGDKIDFQLKATISGDYAAYDEYFFAFHDKESAGLTFDPTSVKVYVDSVQITKGFEVKTKGLSDGCTFEVVFANLKDVTAVTAGSVITVEYQSTLNENAVLGSAGNTNKMYGEFSNNPNDTQHGKTKEDTVVVFTYKPVVNKVNGESKPLVGAGFTLYKEVKDSNTVGAKTGSAIKAELAAQNKSINADALKNDSYYVALAMTTVSGNEAQFEFKGIDDGTYVIVETKIPDGYNAFNSKEFKVQATHDAESATPALTQLTGGDLLTGDVATGELKGEIENNSGATLPSTGGIGTTIFYVVGSILVVAAGVLLITKKRMGRE